MKQFNDTLKDVIVDLDHAFKLIGQYDWIFSSTEDPRLKELSKSRYHLYNASNTFRKFLNEERNKSLIDRLDDIISIMSIDINNSCEITYEDTSFSAPYGSMTCHVSSYDMSVEYEGKMTCVSDVLEENADFVLAEFTSQEHKELCVYLQLQTLNDLREHIIKDLSVGLSEDLWECYSNE